MNFFNKNKNYIVISVFSLLLVTACVVQIKYDKIVHPQIIFHTETRYILPSSIVNNFSFGFKNLLADLYWVKAIQDFSIWDGTDPFYVQEYKNISTLDPKFSYPYLLGILTFTSRSVDDKNGKISTLETIEPVINTGIKNLPNNWEIPFYMGTGYQLTKNPEKALYYLQIASSHPDAPEIIHNVYKSYLKNTITGDIASKEFVRAIYDTTSSETTKKILKEGVMINDLKDILISVVNKYKKIYGVYPTSIDDLEQHKLLQVGPEFKKEFNVKINPYNGNVSITTK